MLPALANDELFMFCTKVMLVQINSSETSVIPPKTRSGYSDSANSWRQSEHVSTSVVKYIIDRSGQPFSCTAVCKQI